VYLTLMTGVPAGLFAAAVFSGKTAAFCAALSLSVLCAVILAYGSFRVQSQIYVRTVNGWNRGDRRIALTFDDGPLPQTRDILDCLDARDIKGVFFCTGDHVAGLPDVAREIVKRGHEIGNHTLTHSAKAPFFSWKRIRREIEETEKRIMETTGTIPRFFRPPFGVTWPGLARALRTSGYTVIGWTFRTLDTRISDAEKLRARVVSKVRGGEILVFHDHTPRVAEKCAMIVDDLTAKGYSFVSLGRLIGKE
jgi:peptidoglycan/xylan/chitin deacetylase (PgdA/CDA1 family)